MIKCPKCNSEMEIKNIDGIELDVCTSCAGIFLDDGEFESFTGIDPHSGYVRLSRFSKVLEKLHEKAILDELTQVYTRKYYNEIIKNVFENKNRGQLTLIMMDIDDFKNVNTIYGHDGGDKVLKEVASHINCVLRLSRDDYLFRLGGEEFAVLLFNLNIEDSFNTAEFMRRIIAMEPIKMPGGEIHHVTISAGVAMSRPTDTPDSIYKRADELLYEAKNSGKNKVVIEKP